MSTVLRWYRCTAVHELWDSPPPVEQGNHISIYTVSCVRSAHCSTRTRYKKKQGAISSLVETSSSLTLVASSCHQRVVEQSGRARRCRPCFDETIRRKYASCCGERRRCQGGRQRHREKHSHHSAWTELHTAAVHCCRPREILNGAKLSQERIPRNSAAKIVTPQYRQRLFA